MSPGHYLNQRQVWAKPTAESSAVASHCTPITLTASAVLTLDDTSTITLASKAFLAPKCTPEAQLPYPEAPTDISSIADLEVPFYASTIPQIYAIATATVISYMLLIMLVITPRTFFVGGAGGGGGFLGQQGMIGGASGRTSVVGIGGRPWLQKVAALTVVISLTVASANTFKNVKEQYEVGYIDASALSADVVGSLEVRIVRVISDAFLWLAQVQTLIRLFPRHREKVIIKWAGFALIILDTIFAVLNNFFVNSGKTKPRYFVDAIPALAYLFQLALSLLYAAWVIYYSCSKRRFAYYHPKMRNICLVAVLALTAVLIPVVFFVLDISKPNVAGWGDYFRWVGAAAASVVVWEWVERIETLERDEKKDGILGREIFDGDEMLEVTTSQRVQWLGDADSRNGGNGGNAGAGPRSTGNCALSGAVNKSHRPSDAPQHPDRDGLAHTDRGVLQRHSRRHTSVVRSTTNHGPSQSLVVPPLTTATPVSRSDTTSAASTEYAVHYHPMSQLSPPIAEHQSVHTSDPSLDDAQQHTEVAGSNTIANTTGSFPRPDPARSLQPASTSTNPGIRPLPQWQAMKNPFKRRRASPPPELASATAIEGHLTASRIQSQPTSNTDPWVTRPRIGIKFMTKQAVTKRVGANDKNREKPAIVVVPAQPRGRTWSPETLETFPIDIAVPQQHESSGATPGEAGTESVKMDTGNCEHLDQQRQNESLPDDLRRGSNAYPADIQDAQLLSQRGSLLISEARGRPGLQCASNESTNRQEYHYRFCEQPSSQLELQPPTLSQTGAAVGDPLTSNQLSSTLLESRASAQNYVSTRTDTPAYARAERASDDIPSQHNDPNPSSLHVAPPKIHSQEATSSSHITPSHNPEPAREDLPDHDPGG
ncbi:MAG: pH-response regulator protein palH/rim21 [Candelina mexicana]|nr:MAG: pH-response regulator protein palH/rim21 [Candelina mexicana]